MSCKTKLDYAGKDIRVITSGAFQPDVASAFAADEVAGGILTFANVGTCDTCDETSSPAAAYGEILELKLVERLGGSGSLQLINFDLLLFTASFTAPAQHTTYPISGGTIAGLDPASFVGKFSIGGYEQFDDVSATAVIRGEPMFLPAYYYAQTLYGLLIAQGAGTYTDESSTLEVILTIAKH